MNWVSIIPVRDGSKGVKNKNIRLVCGKPLYRHTVDFALDAGTKKIYITTNIKQILNTPREKKVVLAQREEIFCQDKSVMSAVILNFLTGPIGAEIADDQIVVLLQATSPLRKKKDLLRALDQFSKARDTDLLMAVTQVENHSLKYGYVINRKFKHVSEPHFCFENRQNLPKLFRPTGAFYIFNAGWYRRNKTFATQATGAYKIPNKRSLDIDSVEDFKKFENMVKQKGKKRENSK